MDTLSWLSASNVPPQIRPLNWASTSVAHSRENCILWPWAYKARMYGGAAFQKPLLSNACAQRREKPGVRSSNSAPLSHEKIWAWMNLYEEFLDLSVQSRFPPQLSFKEGGIFYWMNSFRLWQHLKKARICFQSKERRSSTSPPLRCLISFGVPLNLSTLARALRIDARLWYFKGGTPAALLPS